MAISVVLTGPAAHAQEPPPLAEVSVYPNPAHIRATVQVPAVAGATRATITLTDAQGTVVFEQPVSLTEAGGTAEVPLLGRTPGLYRVQVQAGDQRVARPLKVE
ncbi:T9SS type A sorting domain-containing protein [Hymenobacter antarcticus]|uniref:Secretion system C-terminal sorting domain-containing protein n=1 Tax=Hymenobacter antarcticus TaxID=486270 RepID=A0ABP7QLG0_9BACT